MASSSIALSTFIRIAKDGSSTDALSAVAAIKAATGFPDSLSLDANQASLLRHIDSIAQTQSQDPASTASMLPLRDGITMTMVHVTLGALLEAGMRQAALTGTHDPNVVGHAAQRFLIPAMERLGHLERIATVMTPEQRALLFGGDFYTINATGIHFTQLTRLSFTQATDPVDAAVGRLPIDMSNGLRRASVLGAKELTALEPELAAAIKNLAPLPARYNANTLATKYTLHMVLRMLAPIITSRMKACALYCSVSSVHDVLLANNLRSPVTIVIEEQRPPTKRRANEPA